MGAKRHELLLVDPGSLDPSSSHLTGLPVASLMMTDREKDRLLRKKDGNGHSGHLAFLVKPAEVEAALTKGLSFPMIKTIPGGEKAELGNISNFTEIRVAEEVFRTLCENHQADAELFPGAEKLDPNACCIIRSDENIALAIYKKAAALFFRVPDPYMISGRISPLTAELAFAWWMLRDPSIPIVSLWGPAGTGKSTIALHAAFEQILAGSFKQLLIFKSTQQARGQIAIAAVPGDSYKKFADQRQPVQNTLSRVRKDFLHLLHQNKKEAPQKRGKKPISPAQGPDFGIPVDIQPVNFIRGDEYRHSFIFAEEAQNMIPDNILLLGTRGGEGSKIVVVGDKWQVDHPGYKEETNGLSDMLKVMGGRETFGQVNLTKCLRKGIAMEFVDAYCNNRR